MSKEIITKEINPLAEKAENLVITKDTMPEATSILSKINKNLDKIKHEKDTIIQPLKATIKIEEGRWKPAEDVLKYSKNLITSKMSAYQTAEEKRQKEEEDKIANRVGEGKGKLKVETAINKIENLDKPDAKVFTEDGSVQFRNTPKLKITDENKIPRKYLVVNESKLKADLISGMKIAGAEIEIIKTVVNRKI